MAKCAVATNNRLLDASYSDAVNDEPTEVVDIEKCKAPEAIKEAPSARLSRVLKPVNFWIVFMVLTGGATDYVADFATDVVTHAPSSNAAIVFLITALSFLGSALPPSFKAADRESIWQVNRRNKLFKFKVLVPSLADLLITGMRFVAILYTSPAVVSLLKSSTQLLALSVIQHFRGKRLTCGMALSLLGAFVGQLVVSSVSVLKPAPGVQGPAVLGVLLGAGSGALGALRNIFEEALLQGDNLSTGGLLMAESWISMLGVVVTTLVWQAGNGKLTVFLGEVGTICAMAEIWPIFLTLMFCTYGKDFGKLFVTKYANALTAKVCCLLFALVTWILSLLSFVATGGRIGEGLNPVSSPIRLAGFALVAGFCSAFVVLQKRNK